MNDIMEYKENENFNNLVIESSHGEYYGFNLKVKKERSYATKIVSPADRDDFMVVGCKVAKKLSKWIRNGNSWIDFISGMEDDKNKQGVDHEDGEEEGEEEEAVEEEEDNDERWAVRQWCRLQESNGGSTATESWLIFEGLFLVRLCNNKFQNGIRRW